jgi:PAS domain S-box-containing protein
MISETAIVPTLDLGSNLLAEPEVFYRTVLESLLQGVLITDAEWRICYANRLVSEISGYTAEELLGRTVHEVFLPDDHPQKAECQTRDALSDQPECRELELKRKDGQLHWVHIKTTPYRNDRGEILGTIVALGCIKREKCLQFENELLQDEIRLSFGSIIGQSPVLQKVLTQIGTVAPTEANVLILGESGTGKELVARAIHDLSARKEHSLVRVNCASIPKELFESEFFGHVRGAFTGAVKDRIGRFELADGGTLFLDEIAEIPLDLQSKLLRVLQEGQFERLGEDRTRTVKVRLIAATNRDLLAETKAGRFRLDLYYRLSVFPIEVPPLRERLDDIGSLAEHFIKQSARRLGVPRPRLTKLHIHELQSYDWPGNVRELQNVIERAVILARDAKLQFDLPHRRDSTTTINREKALPFPMGGNDDDGELSLDELVFREREIVLKALNRSKWKIYGTDGAAALLKIRPTTLVSKVKRLKIQKP